MPYTFPSGQGASSTSHSFKGLVQFYRDNEVDNELILHTDRKILIVTLSIKPPIIPAPGMSIEIAGEGKVLKIVRVNRDPASATYICQARL